MKDGPGDRPLRVAALVVQLLQLIVVIFRPR